MRHSTVHILLCVFFQHFLHAEPDFEDLIKPETNCPIFKCPEPNQVPVQKSGGSKKSSWPFTYPCEKSPFNMMMGADLESIKNGKMGGQNSNEGKLRQCCEIKQANMQICGRSKKDIEDSFKSCYKKKCKGDKNCLMQASFSSMMSGGMADDKCGEYNKTQKENCVCVDEKEVEGEFQKTLKSFYGVFAKDKLPDNGEIDDKFMESTVYKKFEKQGPKANIWNALFAKYVKKLQSKIRPQPDIPDMPKDEPIQEDLDGTQSHARKKSFDKKSDTTSEDGEGSVFGEDEL